MEYRACTNCKYFENDNCTMGNICEWVQKEEDKVNHPRHYKTGGIETIDFIQAKMSKEQFEGYCLGQIWKYTTRYRHKNGKEDLQKAEWYMKKLLEVVE